VSLPATTNASVTRSLLRHAAWEPHVVRSLNRTYEISPEVLHQATHTAPPTAAAEPSCCDSYAVPVPMTLQCRQPLPLGRAERNGLDGACTSILHTPPGIERSWPSLRYWQVTWGGTAKRAPGRGHESGGSKIWFAAPTGHAPPLCWGSEAAQYRCDSLETYTSGWLNTLHQLKAFLVCWNLHFYTEDGGNAFLRNAGAYPPH
jgi:hypothetical protein